MRIFLCLFFLKNEMNSKILFSVVRQTPPRFQQDKENFRPVKKKRRKEGGKRIRIHSNYLFKLVEIWISNMKDLI
jgi:hypothetical protein